MDAPISFDEKPIKGSSIPLDDEYPPAEPFVEAGDRPITAKPSQFNESAAFAGPEVKG